LTVDLSRADLAPVDNDASCRLESDFLERLQKMGRMFILVTKILKVDYKMYIKVMTVLMAFVVPLLYLQKANGSDFSSAGTILHARYRHSSLLLKNGNVLIYGGQKHDMPKSGSSNLDSFEIYSVKGKTSIAEYSSGIIYPSSALFLPLGDILILGRELKSRIMSNSAQIWHQKSDDKLEVKSVWASSQPFVMYSCVFTGGACQVLNDSQILVPNILGNNPDISNGKVILLNPVTGSTAEVSDLIHSYNSFPVTTLLKDGRVLFTGNEQILPDQSGNTQARPTGLTEIYENEKKKFVDSGQMNVARIKHTATLLPDGRVLICGGVSEFRYTDTAELFDPKKNEFRLLSNKMLSKRANHQSILMKNGKVLIIGGGFENNISAEIYDPLTEKFVSAGQLTTYRKDPSMVNLEDGKVLIIGGNGYDQYKNPTGKVLSTVEIFNPD
jgi:hypothetical protein